MKCLDIHASTMSNHVFLVEGKLSGACRLNFLIMRKFVLTSWWHLTSVDRTNSKSEFSVNGQIWNGLSFELLRNAVAISASLFLILIPLPFHCRFEATLRRQGDTLRRRFKPFPLGCSVKMLLWSFSSY